MSDNKRKAFEEFKKRWNEELRREGCGANSMWMIRDEDYAVWNAACEWQTQQAQGKAMEPVPDEEFGDEFERWWEDYGQFVRSGGGYYEKTFSFAAFRHLMPEVLAYRSRSTSPASAPPEWKVAIGKALDRALMFDDGSDGADAESASSVVAILSDLLRDPRMTGREPLPAPAAVPGHIYALQAIAAGNISWPIKGGTQVEKLTRTEMQQMASKALAAPAPAEPDRPGPSSTAADDQHKLSNEVGR